MRFFLFWFFALLLQEIFSASARPARAEPRCPHIRILEEDSLKLTDVELRLLCGDTDPSREGKAWKDIPVSQAEKNFRNFLQDRGYYFPFFKKTEHGVVEFAPGRRSIVRRIVGQRVPREIHIGAYRSMRGEPLTPKRVSEVKSWVLKRLREEGYPCPQLEATADPKEGVIVVEWKNPRPKAWIAGVREDPKSDPALSVLRRYDAFEEGQSYSLIATEVSARRSSRAKVTFSHDLAPSCPVEEAGSGDKVFLLESVVMGAPRTLNAGISINSDVGPWAHASWSHARVGRLASLVEGSVESSLKEQQGRLKSLWYYSDSAPRGRLEPSLMFSHENARRYQALSFRSQALWGEDRDAHGGNWNLSAGPSWQWLNQLQGVGPRLSRIFELHLNLGFVSHRFEYFSASPREGHSASLNFSFAPQGIRGAGRPVSLALRHMLLLSPGESEPPWAVYGVRSQVFAAFAPRGTSMSDLPIRYRRWIGGGGDLRGFGYEEIPGNPFGARWGAVLGAELRIPRLLPLNLEPLLLADGAGVRSGSAVGSEASLFFWDAGFGLRLETSFAVFRLTLAHGFEAGKGSSELSHWQLYGSIGEEF